MLNIIDLHKSEEWDKIVKENCYDDAYYQSGYIYANKLEFGETPLLLHFEKDDIQIINIVSFRDISENDEFKEILPKGEFFDITTPYGYGGIIVNGNLTQKVKIEFIKEYSNFLKDHGVISEFVRFHPFYETPFQFGDIYDIEYNRKTVYMDLKDEESLWGNMKSTSRNRIRKIQERNPEVKSLTSKRYLKQFIDLYYVTMDKNNAENSYYFSEKYFEELMTSKDQVELFGVLIDGELISGMIVLKGSESIHYHLGATNPKYYSLSPNNLLFYEVGKWGVRKGYKKFHLGGGHSGENDGLFRFKKSMNKNGLINFYIGTKVWDDHSYEKLTKIKKDRVATELSTNFFPAYRA
ncbi:lipid II:glycine glycyltransferase FemX [Salimicrobium flavidum]|uniref:Lipid II:glycine glycyltransferase n=1 Tax=Salimicrobium flavidum TaxID=570947 RepID=A0A1N7IZJ2_9BACI|nr:GNAT family N-acetyltransferase [Salimicrobium flavidum]SIS42459.1 Acetyltransferase (GNAT) domain-containing protein [Salimicrobium flavidum]